MHISWFGQSCFRLETKDVKIMIDPFSKDIGLRMPRFNDNIYLVTHNHYDHNNTESAGSEAFIINGPGEYEKSGVQVVGIQSFHDNVQGQERGYNTIYVVTADEIRLCHLGDFGQDQLTEEQLNDIGEVDILCVPIGGTYTIDAKTAVKIVKQIEPKIIIPMHYSIAGLNIKLDSEKTFVKELGIAPEKVDVLKIQKKQLPVEETLLYVFNI